MSNENSNFYDDVYAKRVVTPLDEQSDKGSAGLVSSKAGQRRRDKNEHKSLFADFMPSIAVYNMKGGTTKPGLVFSTHRITFTQIQESVAETTQIMKTFSPKTGGEDVHVNFFGEQPRVYQFSGNLFHLKTTKTDLATDNSSGVTPDLTSDANWFDNFKYAYENLLKGSKCAEYGLQVRLNYDWRWAQGYLLNFSSTLATLGSVPFTLSMLVKKSGLYHKADSLTAKPIVDSATRALGNEALNEGAFMTTPDQKVRFLFEA
jgi:hypothetical protein